MAFHKYHTKGEISAALKRRLRTLRWQPEAIMREVVLIQRLRELALVERDPAPLAPPGVWPREELA